MKLFYEMLLLSLQFKFDSVETPAVGNLSNQQLEGLLLLLCVIILNSEFRRFLQKPRWDL